MGHKIGKFQLYFFRFVSSLFSITWNSGHLEVHFVLWLQIGGSLMVYPYATCMDVRYVEACGVASSLWSNRTK